MENPYANVLHLSLFHFFWISIYHCALCFFLFQDILFPRLIPSLSGWFLFFWSQTFLFLCILVNMIFCFVCFIIRIAAWFSLYCWLCEKFLECLKICILWSCLLLNMKNRKHVNLKDIKSEYELTYYDLFYSISFVYMHVCKPKNKNVCNRIVLSWFSLLTVTWVYLGIYFVCLKTCFIESLFKFTIHNDFYSFLFTFLYLLLYSYFTEFFVCLKTQMFERMYLWKLELVFLVFLWAVNLLICSLLICF